MLSCFIGRTSRILICSTMLFLPAMSPHAAQSAVNSGSAVQQTKSAADVLRSTLKAVEGIDSIEYEVRVAYSDRGKHYRFRTSVSAARLPYRYSARTQDDDAGTRELAVMDGATTQAGSEGEISESPAFSADGLMQPMLNQASASAARTWRLLLDRDFLSTAINSGNIMPAGVDDVDGELCDIVAYVRIVPQLGASGSIIDLFWISAKTGLPRAVQGLALIRGETRLSNRAVISVVRVNPKIPEGTFTYKPVAADSSPAQVGEGHADGDSSHKNLQGTHLPDLEVKDKAYNSVKLSAFIGRPLLIAFWSSWCGPCQGELETLAKLEPTYSGKLRVIAIAIQDSRLNVESWIKDHPGYNFTYVTDPELPSLDSHLVMYIGSHGVSETLLVDGKGTVIDAWSGFTKPDELEKRLAHFLSSFNN